MTDKVKKSLDMIRAVHDDKCATINGRDYIINNINHSRRRKVFAFFSSAQSKIQMGDFSFLESEGFAETEKVINNVVTFEGSSISKMPNHWDDYPEDYIMFITTMLSALSYPFLQGLSGN